MTRRYLPSELLAAASEQADPVVAAMLRQGAVDAERTGRQGQPAEWLVKDYVDVSDSLKRAQDTITGMLMRAVDVSKRHDPK